MMIKVMWSVFSCKTQFITYSASFVFGIACFLVIPMSVLAQHARTDSVMVNTKFSNVTSVPGLCLLPNNDSVYQVLYDTIPANKVVSSIGYLKGDKLLSTPGAFINNAFTGRIAGIYTLQNSGEPGNNSVSIALRGRNPLVLVDGVPREPYSINPEEIKSITVLKDALSTVMLGMRSMSGAILITTRKGSKTPGFHMDMKAQSGIFTPIKLPKPLPAYQYANLYNEALANDGRSPLYSESDLNDYKNHTDPYGHPDINWYDKILKKQTSYSRYTFDAAGSNKALRYFVSLDYLQQNGLFHQSSVNTYSTNTDYKRYIFRSNVNVNLTSKLSMYLNLFGRVRNQNEPGSGTGSIFNALLSTPNNAYPSLNPDTSLGGNVNYDNNIYGQTVLSGYTREISSDGYADLGFKLNLDDLLKGWWVKAKSSYILTVNQNINRSKQFATFEMNIDPATGDTTYNRYGTEADQSNSSSVGIREHEVYAQIASGYSHQWNNNGLNVLLLYNVNSYTTNSNLPLKYKTLAGKVKYTLENKYILEAATSYSGNNRYAPGDRYGFFPAIGAGWNIQNENFFNKNGFINTLKLRASYGLTGDDVAGYYEYINHYVGASGYYFGTGASFNSGITEYQPLNVTTWEKGLKLDIGLNAGFAKNRGSISIDYYRNKLTDVVQPRGKNSAILGWGNTIQSNLGKDRYSGLEITAGWSDKVGSFGYYISGNFSVSNSKILFDDEPDYPYPRMQHTGHQVGQIFGYVANGFVTQTGDGPVVEGYQSVPGDIKYKDLNSDGVINQFDEKAIGNQKPLMFYGTDIGFTWKHFSLSLLLQGVANRNLLLTGPTEWAFQNGGTDQAWQHNLNRWTQQTASTATYPRLSIGTNPNNDVPSTLWIRSGNYLRLKNAEIAYSFNKINLRKVHINQLRIFINGLNLITFSKLKQSDPETLAGSYPIERVLNAGIAIKF